jgi:putative ABC transport system permease protein
VHTLAQDLRYGFRVLLKTPGISLVAVLTMALGIGATTAIFTFVDAALIHSLPFHEGDRLVQVSMTKVGDFGKDFEASYPTYTDWKTQNSVFSSMGGYSQDGVIVTTTEASIRVQAAIVSGEFFSTLGVNAAMGRTFTAKDDERQETPGVLISYGFWQRQYGGKSSVLGQPLTADGHSYMIIGVLPRNFEFAPVGAADIFQPVPIGQGFVARRNLHWFNVVARLKPGMTLEKAAAEMQTISARLAQLYPAANGGTTTKITPLREVIVGDIRPTLLLLFAAAGFVLLIACANIANVLLAKAAGRSREVAIRNALGASPRRIIRQFLTESVLLGMISGAAGLLLAVWGVSLLADSVPKAVREGVPFLTRLPINGTVLGFAMAISLLTGVLFGLAPALRISATNLRAALSDDSRTTAGGRQGLRDLLVIAEVGLAAMLLVGAGLLLQSLWRVVNTDPGFNRQNLLTMRYALPPGTYKEDAKVIAYERAAEEKIAGLPGVQGVAVGNILPLTCNGCNTVRFRVQGQAPVESAVQPEGNIRVITPSYFGVLQARMLKGRQFTDADGEKSPKVVIVNRALADEYYGGDAVGKTLTFTYAPNQPAREIVGLVGDVKETSLDTPNKPALYLPFAQDPSNFASVLVRTSGDPLAAAESVRQTMLSIEQQTAIFNPSSMELQISNSMPVFLRRLGARLVSLFGWLALLLAAIGIYGVVSYSVAQRTREFGVRMALGARAEDVLRLVMGRAARLVIPGIVAGLVGAAALAKIASRMLYGVRPTDVFTFAAATVLVATVALLASYIPARRAARLHPLDALRYE